MPKREYGIKICAAGDTDENGWIKSDTLKMERSTTMEGNQNNQQTNQQTTQQTGGSGGTGQQAQSDQQGTPPAIDYDKIQKMLDGTLSAKEDTVLKAYFKQQGLSQEEMDQANAAFKQQKAANQPDVNAIQGQLTDARAQLEASQAAVRQAQLQSAATMAAVALGMDAKTIPYVLKMADLSQVMGQDGKINEESLRAALNKVLEDVPALKPQAGGSSGFLQVGAAGGQSQQSAQNQAGAQQGAVPTKRWNRFNN